MSRISTPVPSLLVALGLAACGGEATGGPTAFRGTIANANENGVMDVTVGSPISGTLAIVGGAVNNLSGDFNAETGQFTASGGGYSLTGTFSSGMLNGTYTGPNGSGGLTAFSSDQQVVQVFCGTFSGDATGFFNLVRGGNSLSGVSVETSPAGEVTLLTGSISGSTVTISESEGGSATGTLAGESMSGTWVDVTGANGTWSASTAACG